MDAADAGASHWGRAAVELSPVAAGSRWTLHGGVGWSRLRRRCGDGAAAIDEAIVGAAPWRWRTGRLNRRDGEMDDGSSSGEVDEGRRAVAVDDVVGEEAPAGQR